MLTKSWFASLHLEGGKKPTKHCSNKIFPNITVFIVNPEILF